MLKSERDAIMLAEGWVITATHDNGIRRWDRDGHGISDVHAEIDIGATPCAECGDHYQVQDRAAGDNLCFLCGFWLEQLAHPEEAFVTENWRHKRSSKPSPLHGGLWDQGEIPERFRDRFASRRAATDQGVMKRIGE